MSRSTDRTRAKTPTGPCAFRRVPLKSEKQGSVARGTLSGRAFLLHGAAGDGVELFEGPLDVKSGARSCRIEGGVFSEVHLSRDGKLLMTVERNGSCGEHRLFDAGNCHPIGEKASYCGGARIVGNSLVNPPACEQINESLQECGRGKVYSMDVKDRCTLSLDHPASDRLTYERLRVHLPAETNARVRFPGTERAVVVED